MLERIRLVPLLTCALLLLTTTPLLAKAPADDTLERFEVRSRLGTLPAGTNPPSPMDGVSEPGDDDMPNKDGSIVIGNMGGKSAVGKAQGGSWGIQKFAVRLRLQMLRILRTLR